MVLLCDVANFIEASRERRLVAFSKQYATIFYQVLGRGLAGGEIKSWLWCMP